MTQTTVIEPNDPYFSTQYSLWQTRVDEAWAITEGDNNSTIAVLDTGIDASHPDLKDKIRERRFPGEQDVSRSPEQCSHGTHIAGIISANRDNAKGIAGITNASILDIPVLDANERTQPEDFAAAIRLAVDEGVSLINASIVGRDLPGLREAVEYAARNDVLIIAPSGNGENGPVGYPAAYEECLGVAAVDIDSSPAVYSNLGEGVDLFAPGTDIISTDSTGDYGYLFRSGTSTATATVAGIANLTMTNLGIQGCELAEHLVRSSVQLSSTPAFMSGGLVDAYKSVTQSAPVSMSGKLDNGRECN